MKRYKFEATEEFGPRALEDPYGNFVLWKELAPLKAKLAEETKATNRYIRLLHKAETEIERLRAALGEDKKPKPLSARDLLLLKALSSGKWHTSDDLAKVVGHRYGAYVLRIRQNGHDIESKPVSTGIWHYRLKLKPKGKK